MKIPPKAGAQPPIDWRKRRVIFTRCAECGGPWIEHSNAVGRFYYDREGFPMVCLKFVRVKGK